MNGKQGGDRSFGRSLENFKSTFFDSEKVQRAVDRAVAKTLSKFGAFVRTRSRSSIRKAPAVNKETGIKTRRSKKNAELLRDATAKPPAPPFSHSGLLKQFIFFGYDTATKSVVVGPMKLNSKRGGGAEFLEHGGDTTIRSGKRERARQVHYTGNPFMAPAAQEELPKFMDSLKDSVTDRS